MSLPAKHRDPRMVAEGRRPLHALGVPADALVLDGDWQFRHWTGTAPDDGWEQPDHRRADFGRLELPASWSVQGHGIPIYTNVRYPFDVRAFPEVTMPDEGGDHVRTVDVPAPWRGTSTGGTWASPPTAGCRPSSTSPISSDPDTRPRSRCGCTAGGPAAGSRTRTCGGWPGSTGR